MTKAFNELINKQQFLHEAAPVSGAPVVSWIDDIVKIVDKCYGGVGGGRTATLLEGLYPNVVGYLAQRNVDLTYYPIQDLLRRLSANKKINPSPYSKTVMPWKNFVDNVQANITDPEIDDILKDWETQLQSGNWEEYVIKDPTLLKEYNNKRRDKEAVSTAALSVYNKDTVYNTLVKIVEKRLIPLQQFEGAVARRLGNVAKYEVVLRTILNNPADVAASVKKLPGDFFKYCDIDPRTLVSLSLACAAFYKSECARITSLAIDRLVKATQPAAQQPTATQPVTQQPAAQPAATQPAATQPASGKYNARDSRGRFTKKLDLASLQSYDNILSMPSFGQFVRTDRLITEADTWGSITNYVRSYGGKAIQGIWSGVKYALTGTKKMPSTITEYESFLRTGIIKTKVSVPLSALVPGGPSDEIEITIDSSKEKINNLPVVYNIELITALASSPSAKEAQELRDHLRNLAENIRRDQEDYVGDAAKAFAAAS